MGGVCQPVTVHEGKMQGKTLVTGAAGQLGAELCRLLGPRAIATDIDTLDLTDGPAVREALDRWRPAVVINCAAYTRVDQAESEAELCRAVNVTAVEHLAAACGRLDCPLVEISTDYVFGNPGGGRPHREADPTSPQGVYARSKLAGELAAARHARHIIVRTCGLYARPTDPRAQNFVKTILRLAHSRDTLRVVADQHCTPSYVPHVARAVLFLAGLAAPDPVAGKKMGTGTSLRSEPVPIFSWGIYHVTNSGATTWHEMACEIVRLAGLKVAVQPITTAEYPLAAPRPAYSVLDTTAYHRLGGPAMPDWKTALAEYFAELAE
jgi:dTDP-4-dehydrorhamnose reductase